MNLTELLNISSSVKNHGFKYPGNFRLLEEQIIDMAADEMFKQMKNHRDIENQRLQTSFLQKHGPAAHDYLSQAFDRASHQHMKHVKYITSTPTPDRFIHNIFAVLEHFLPLASATRFVMLIFIYFVLAMVFLMGHLVSRFFPI